MADIEENKSYSVSEDGKTFKSFDNRDAKEFTVPEEVTHIGEWAFATCASLVSITLPDSLTSIGDRAFLGCSSLKSIVLPAGVTEVCDGAFDYCASLEKIEVDRNNSKYCSLDGVLYTKDFRTLLCYPAGKKDEHFHVPESVTSISRLAFWGCSSLKSILLPASLKEFGDVVFYDCASLEKIETDKNNPNYCSFDGVLYTKDVRTLLNYPAGKREEYFQVPESVTNIARHAFCDCSSLKSIALPDCLKDIGDGAFVNCTSLVSIDLPDSLQELGEGAFDGCTSLSSINLPANLTEIGDVTFYGCTSLTSIGFPTSLTCIGEQAFKDCSSLSSISLPENLKRVGDYAFWGCTSLSSVSFPACLTEIGDVAFYGCSSLAAINLPTNLKNIGCRTFKHCSSLRLITFPEILESIGDHAFGGCTSLKSIHLPDSLTNIGDFAFSRCSSLSSVHLPVNLASIGKGAFDGCSSLKEIEVDANNPKYSSIGGVLYTKDGTTIIKSPEERELNTYFISASVEKIDENAFSGNLSLQQFDVDGDNPNYCHVHGVLFTRDRKTLVRYPAGRNTEEYTVPTSVERISEGAFSSCKSLRMINLPKDIKNIELATFKDCISLESITLPEGVESIGEDAFRGCVALKTIIIPESVTCIGKTAFFQCRSLESIVLPKRVSIIDEWTFRSCSSLEEIVLPTGVTEIRYGAFSDCTSLRTIDIPNNVTYIGEEAFSGCGSLKSINFLPNDVATDKGSFKKYSLWPLLLYYQELLKNKALEEETERHSHFKKNSHINDLSAQLNGLLSSSYLELKKNTHSWKPTFISDLMSMDKNSNFKVISSLATRRGAAHTATIGDFAFKNCKSLTSLNFPKDVVSIGKGVFNGCRSLNVVVLSENVSTVAPDAFDGCPALEAIYVKPGNRTYFSEDGVLFTSNNNKKIIIRVPEGRKVRKYIVPFGVEEIGEYAFRNCSYLEAIILPETIEYIWERSLSCTSSLKSIAVLNGRGVFFSLDGVLFSRLQDGKIFLFKWPEGKEERTYIIPHFVEGVVPSAFKDSKYLNSIVIPKNVTEIESETLWGLIVYAPAGSKVEELAESFKFLFYRI